jgi:hypothetical protein
MPQFKKQIYGIWLNGLSLLEHHHQPYFELYAYGEKSPLRIKFCKNETTGFIGVSNNFNSQWVYYSSLFVAVEDYLLALSGSGELSYAPFISMIRSSLDYVRLIKAQPMLF